MRSNFDFNCEILGFGVSGFGVSGTVHQIT